MNGKSLLFRLTVCAFCVSLSLAARPLSPQQKPSSTVRVATRLVEVSVVAQDKKGEPVADLERDDFEVVEQGKVQTIAVFSIESNRNAIGRTEALPPNTFSNMPAQAGATQNLTVILFDTLNTSFEDQASAKKQLMIFLKQIKPQDRVAVYGLGTSLHVIHDFTGNSEALVRAIDHYSTRLSMEKSGSTARIEDNTWMAENEEEARIIAAMDEAINAANQRVANYYIERRTTITLQALAEIANHLSSLPGRKSLVWLSAGFPFTYGTNTMQIGQVSEGVKNFSEIVARAARSLTDASVAIYPVDARALIGLAGTNPSSSVTVTTRTARQAARIDTQALEEVFSSRDTMQELAEQTGGRASYDTNDVQGAVKRALEDSRATYTLGYYPSDANFNGKFRTIKVSVKRPGVQLTYRRGYYASPGEPLDDATRQKALNAAATGTLDATGVGFSVQVNRPTADALAWQLVLDIDPYSIDLEPQQDNWSGGFDLMLTQFDGKGSLLKNHGRQVPLALTSADRQKMLERGFVLRVPIQLNENWRRLRVVLRDSKSGAVGTVTILRPLIH